MPWNSQGNIRGPKGDTGASGADVPYYKSPNIPLENSTSGSVYYARDGKTIMVTSEQTINGSFSSGSTILATGAIPEEDRPTSTRRGVAYFSGGYSGTAAVTAAGNIEVSHDNTTPRTFVQFTVVYVSPVR